MGHFVFDLETTGLPVRCPRNVYHSFKRLSKYKTSRIVSLSWIVLNDDLQETERKYFVVKPAGFTIPAEATRIHGITNEEATKTGRDLLATLREMESSFARCDKVVAHNLAFDLNILLSELYRAKMLPAISHLLKVTHYCTMMEGMKHMKVRKFPKLSELYGFLHENTAMPNAHNALYDAVHCCECYKKLVATSRGTQPPPHAPAPAAEPEPTVT